MLSLAHLVFVAFLAFAFPSFQAACTWLGPDVANALGYATIVWPFFAIVEGTIGMEVYSWLWAKATKRQSPKRIGIV